MNKLLALLISVIFSIPTLFAQEDKQQSDFERYQQQQQAIFSSYVAQSQADFQNYRDSLNRQFANYLKETWKSFDLQRQERDFKPMPKPPVYTPDAPKPDETPKPIPVKPTPPTKPQPVPETPKPQPQPAPEKETFNTDFFDKTVKLQKIKVAVAPLQGVSESAVADFWLSLSNMPVSQISDDMLRLQSELKLNDWGVYQLANRLVKVYLPNRTKNEEVVFAVFMLNQLGYKARIGRADNELVPLLAIQNRLSNTFFFDFGADVVYYVINQDGKELPSVQTCGKEYNNAGKAMNLSLAQRPDLSGKIEEQNFNYQDKTYTFNYHSKLPDFYATYPCVDFSVYANAPLDELFLETLRANFQPVLQNKSQEEQVNFLLHFVQNAFQYKTDQDNLGYEKWNFAEETLISHFSDCDDRAIFFAQLVKHLLKMEVVLVYYSGYHLATAVHFNNTQPSGSYLTFNNTNYLICDPTYINANIGMEMPQLQGIAVEIINVNHY